MVFYRKCLSLGIDIEFREGMCGTTLLSKVLLALKNIHLFALLSLKRIVRNFFILFAIFWKRPILLEGEIFLRNKHEIAFFEIKCTFFGRKENTIRLNEIVS